MDFSSYKKHYGERERKSCSYADMGDTDRIKKYADNTGYGKDDKKCKEDDVKKAYERYEGMNQDQLMRALFDEVNASKKNGSFDIEQIKRFYREVSPRLSNEQREKMRSIISYMQ